VNRFLCGYTRTTCYAPISVYDADPDLGTLDIVMVDPSGRARRRHARQALVKSKLLSGDHVQFTKPQGNFVVRHGRAPTICFAGEETASVAFRRNAAIAAGHRPCVRGR